MIFYSCFILNKIFEIKVYIKRYKEKMLGGIVLFLIFLAPSPILASQNQNLAGEEKDSTFHIGEIKVVRKNVFDPEIKEENKKLFLWVNKFHLVTKEKIVRWELLFKEGEIYDKKTLEESERNLRNLDFLGKAKIEEIKRDNGKVDILVKTQDQWSTAIYFSASGVGKYYSWEGYFEEHNLLGWGKSLIFGYAETSERVNKQLSLIDNNILGTRLCWQTDIYNRSDGYLYNLLFSRPFYSLETKWAFAVQYSKEKAKIDYYHNSQNIFSYQRQSELFNFEFSKSFGQKWKKILTPFYQLSNKDFSFYSLADSLSYSPLLPANRKLQYLGLSFKLWHPQFEKLSYLDNFRKIEDVDMGWRIQTKWGLNIDHLFSSDRNDIFSGAFLLPFHIGKNQYLFFSHWTNGELRKLRWENIISQSEMRLYWNTPYWQTLVFRALGVFSRRQDKGFQLVLGGANGLRGFEKYRFSGENEIVFNFEDRIFSPWNILTVALGGVIFFDAGYIWDKKFESQKLHSDVGVGLRFGLTKSFGWRTARIDFAKSLETNNWIISFGSGMYFELGGM
jgi:hypothetical protein